ncbi:hypothetical protein ABB37_09463 [Leptomonas pyrrhocoris]|uniref:Chromatin modification-related protein EAF6 n=1 Tax=Leptomonas pyrrhocoris TaxID=157538 RepID=A0A0M9FQU6_LEPPY|nr:hypothetical protein ABB37_09463 [Leptomonas pyrrhocoris]KPA74210.1 hypothetical protein ABB37_09463 [Leptomonas pyrrhocoris]|eukprot:XP_015652649.1 hypothetical protein ABB37_09463 [Leptomonas pyrrhocoris]
MSRREHGSSKAVSSDELLRQEAAVYLPPAVENQLTHIMQRRESVEAALQRMEVGIYDMESELLKHCVSFGGSLFDGFGLERRSNAHRSPVAVLTPMHSSPHMGGGSSASPSGGFEMGTTPASFPGSPLLTTTATGEQHRTYQFLINPFQGDSNGGSDANMGSTSTAVYQVGTKGATSPAFHYRIHFFSPSERVFSACSVGALSRVEIAKSTLGNSNGAAKAVMRSTAAVGAAAARGQGGGKRGRHSSSDSMRAAFAREPDAGPARRRRRDSNDDDDRGDDATAPDGNVGRRRRRHTE